MEGRPSSLQVRQLYKLCWFDCCCFSICTRSTVNKTEYSNEREELVWVLPHTKKNGSVTYRHLKNILYTFFRSFSRPSEIKRCCSFSQSQSSSFRTKTAGRSLQMFTATNGGGFLTCSIHVDTHRDKVDHFKKCTVSLRVDSLLKSLNYNNELANVHLHFWKFTRNQRDMSRHNAGGYRHPH